VNNKLLSVRDLSSFLHVHPKTIFKWKSLGKIPYSNINGSIRFSEKDIEQWINKRNYVPVDPPSIQIKNDISPVEYDKMFLKGRSALSKNNSKRWNYGFGTVYTRKNKDGKTRYCIDYKDPNGKRKREVIQHAQTRAEAILALQKRIEEIFTRQFPAPEKNTISFKEFSLLYLENYAKPNKDSWKCDEYCLNAHLIPYFGNFKLCDITPLAIEKYRTERLSAGKEKSTTNRETALLRKMFNLSIQWGYCKDNPVNKVKLFSEKENQRNRVLSKEEETELLKECAPHLKPIIITALHTGIRKANVLNLKWEQINFNEREITVFDSKSKEYLTVLINDTLLNTLLMLKQERISDFVFPNPETGKPFKTVRRSFNNACRRANIKDLRFHDLRHTFGSRLNQKGADIRSVQDLLGHHSLEMTKRYTHTNKKQKQDAVYLLDEKIPSPKPENPPNLSHICHMSEEDLKKKLLTSLFSVN